MSSTFRRGKAKHCQKQKHEIFCEYIDEASGAKSNREHFKRLFDDAHRKEFDLVLFWALDRFSREGMLETLKHLEKLTSWGVEWKSFTEQWLDSAGVFKEVIVGIMATLAKQERIKISERTIAGLATARRRGKTLGRPKKIFDRERLRKLRKDGRTLSFLAKEFGISRTHASRVAKEG